MGRGGGGGNGKGVSRGDGKLDFTLQNGRGDGAEGWGWAFHFGIECLYPPNCSKWCPAWSHLVNLNETNLAICPVSWVNGASIELGVIEAVGRISTPNTWLKRFPLPLSQDFCFCCMGWISTRGGSPPGAHLPLPLVLAFSLVKGKFCIYNSVTFPFSVVGPKILSTHPIPQENTWKLLLCLFS